MMDENQQKEQFSNAYFRAVVATAGYNVYKPEVDDDSVDWGMSVRGGKGTLRSPKVELQLKCTSQDVVREDHIAYPLPVKNYHDLRHTDYQVPRILVVVVVPKDVNSWLVQTEDSLTLHHCGYWLSLRGFEDVANVATITVELPRTQVFGVADVRQIMQRVAGGGFP
jgi:hypothetical protein